MKVWVVSTQHRGVYCICGTESLAEKEKAKIAKATDDDCWISEEDMTEEELLQVLGGLLVRDPS